MASCYMSVLFAGLVALAACDRSAPTQVAKVAIVADGQLMFTEADIAQYDSSGVAFTLKDSSVTRIATTWSVEIAAPRRKLARPKSFAVLVGGDTTLIGKVQYIESSYLPEGPLMDWPPILSRLRIYAAKAPGIRAADAERIREALRLAGVQK